MKRKKNVTKNGQEMLRKKIRKKERNLKTNREENRGNRDTSKLRNEREFRSFNVSVYPFILLVNPATQESARF